jgi:hypothetical protein
MPHHPKRRGKTRAEALFERFLDSPLVQRTAGSPKAQRRMEQFLDAPATQRALGSHKAQRVLLGPEVIPALWGSLILTGALGLAGFISQIPWNVQ